jgi:hypothetical protein
LNFNFDALSYTTGTPPTNNNFETGDLTGWTVTGTVTVEAGGPGSSLYYARMTNHSVITSSAFSIPTNAQVISFDRQFIDGSDGVKLEIAPGPSYSTWTQIYVETNGPISPWTTKRANITSWAGQSVKARFTATRLIGIDNAAVLSVIHPSWTTWVAGTPYSNVPEEPPDGPSGNYSKLDNGEKIWTSPFTIPANGTTIAEIRRTYFTGSSGLSIYVLTAPDYLPPGN